jgi:hypothetical protein
MRLKHVPHYQGSRNLPPYFICRALQEPCYSAFVTYYNRRLLQCTGHVARMPLTRAPRKILTCSVDNPRPRECPQMNLGRTLKKTSPFSRACHPTNLVCSCGSR